MGINHEIFRIKAKADVKYLAALRDLVGNIFRTEGFSNEEATKMELVAEEAILNVINHALEGNENESFELIVEVHPDKILFALEEMGLPIDWDKVWSGEISGLGITLIKHFADRVNFVNLGKKGKRFEYVKYLYKPNYDALTADQLTHQDIKTEVTCDDINFDIRLTTSDDVIALEKLLYKVYGYDYKEVIYYPERIKDMIRSGILVSFIAVTQKNEIAGHQGLLKQHPDSHTAEIAMGAVDPKFRGRGLFEKLKEISFRYILSQGVYGLYGEAVANHPYSQKANFKTGGKETGILLGFVHPFKFKSIEHDSTQRTSTVAFYNKIGQEPVRDSYAPVNHHAIIRDIYNHADVKRNLIINDKFDDDRLSSHTEFNITTLKDLEIGIIEIISFGKDFRQALKVHLKELCFAKFDAIYLDLPLWEPATQFYTEYAEMLGFFFSSIFIEYDDKGDIFRLQYLNNINIDSSKIVTVTDFGKNLLQYIMDCKPE